jgi:uncharacterized protein YndB with AHSA1/START domain
MAQIRHQIVIEAPAARVFPLVSTGGGFKQWWAADVTERDGATFQTQHLVSFAA